MPEASHSGRLSSREVVAVGINTNGRREVLGVATGPSEAEAFWKGFLPALADRGLRGVKLTGGDPSPFLSSLFGRGSRDAIPPDRYLAGGV